jgi:hypothetical protein
MYGRLQHCRQSASLINGALGIQLGCKIGTTDQMHTYAF